MSSLFSALTTAVSGLDAQSSSIGNISDNLANSETVGYKSVGTSFEELVNASSAAVNNPGGVLSAPQYQNDVQGSITSSQTPTNLAISGSGYFPVETATTDATGTTTFNSQQLFTRQGDFTLNANGYIINSSGFYLTGWTVDSSGVANEASTAPIQVSALLDNPVPTSTTTYTANLPSNAATGFTSSTSTVQIFDSLGNPYDENISWLKTGAEAWSLTVGVTDSTGASKYSATVPITFNTSSGTTTAGTIATINPVGTGPDTYTVDSPTTDGSEAGINISLPLAGGTQVVDLNLGTYDGSTGVTQFADTNDTVSVSDFTQNGLPRGSFNNLSVSKDGIVTLNYSNGTTKAIAQVPIVLFNDEDQLQRVTGGAYTPTLESGTPNYHIAGQIGSGTISSSSLEQSNVDIAAQFTTLIEAQQVYAANAKVVTADDGLLQTTVNMVQ
jgi:flagellar hook protein FlgE